MEGSHTRIVFFLIGVSAVVLLLLITAVILLRSTAKDRAAASVLPSPAASTPSPAALPAAAQTSDLPTDPVERLRGLPFTLPANLPGDLWVSADANTASDFESYTIRMDTPTGDFRITMTATRAVGATELEAAGTARSLPPVYAYEPADFEPIATIGGVELLVSRTGAAGYEEGTRSARLIAVPPQRYKTEGALEGRYYVYQKYPYGISEYLNVYSTIRGQEPSYNDTVIIDYSLLGSSPDEVWRSRKAILRDALAVIKKKQVPESEP